MNAKIAAAISLGASSLALIGSISIANAANAADATTTDTSNHPAAQVKTISDTGFNAVSNVVTIDPQNSTPQTVNSPVTGEAAAGKQEKENSGTVQGSDTPKNNTPANAEILQKVEESKKLQIEAKNKHDEANKDVEEAKQEAEDTARKINEAVEKKNNAENSIAETNKKIENRDSEYNKCRTEHYGED